MHNLIDLGAVFAGERSWCVLNMDNRDVLPILLAGSVQHTISDPPYEEEAHTLQRRVRTETLDGGDRAIASAPLDFAPMTEDDRDWVGAELGRITKRWTLVFCQVEAAMRWRKSVECAHVDYVRTQIWVKKDPQPQLTGDRPGMGYESIVTLHRKGKKEWNGGGSAGVYHFLKNPAGRTYEHPTEKPIDLMLELVRRFTDPGDLVLDPYCGSGTTGVACLRLGRRFIGIERDEKYAALSIDRMKAEQQGSTIQATRAGQGALFSGGQ